MPRLIMFDIDGTLASTDEVDSRCYVQALFEHLGTTIRDDWSTYRHVTDSGIAAEVLARHGRPPNEAAAVRERFVRLISDALRESPTACAEVPGAAAMLRRLRRTPGVVLGLATGGWAASARAKLAHASIDVAGLPLAWSDDAEARADLMTACRDRVAAAGGPPVTDVVYVGDGAWDAEAARALGWRFVGIGTGDRADGLRRLGAAAVFPDYRDADAVLAALGAGQAKAPAVDGRLGAG